MDSIDAAEKVNAMWQSLGEQITAAVPDLTVMDLRVHNHILDIRFWREGEETIFEVLRGDPKLIERRRMGAELERLTREPEPTASA